MKWHKGPPPHVGWWLANPIESPDIWRWWNGKYWSAGATCWLLKEQAEYRAKHKSLLDNEQIYWCDYYPENARVPRINPNESEFEMEVTIKRRIFARDVWWRRALRAFWRWC